MMRGRNTQTKMLQWEKILKVMLNGQPVTKESLEAMPEMKGVPLYRLSTFVWRIKMTGGVVKVVKDGRKVAGYQLANTDEMQKYLDKREKVFAVASKKEDEKAQKKAERAAAKATKPVKVKKVKKLKDLQATPVVEKVETVVEDEIQVTEITESENV
jgi:hypothetical protein